MSEFGLKALQIAIKEMESGAGEVGENNAGPWVQKYLCGHAEPPANWCAAFVCWCLSEAYYIATFDPGYILSARKLFTRFKGDKKLVADPEPGDLIFFWRESPDSWMGHVGIVWKVKGKSLVTIEGNKGTFPAKVRDYIYPDYKKIPNLLGFARP